MPLAELVGKTAIETAIGLVRNHLEGASKVERANVAACAEYLRAAQAAVFGLEQEVDEILIECKSVARTYWTTDKRESLLLRIETYLNVDRLRPLLDEAIRGIDACHNFAVRDARAFFLGTDIKRDATDNLLETLASLQAFLRSLDNVMKLSAHNYAGPSGLNAPALLELVEVLENTGGLPEEVQRTRLRELAADGQSKRERRGLTIVADAARTIQELTVAFRLALS